MASTAIAVPRRARLWMLRVFILAYSHRNNGDISAACDAHYWTGRDGGGSPTRRRSGSLLGGYRAALEARHVAARREGRVAVDRPVGEGEQHLLFVRRVGVNRDLDVTGGNRTFEFGRVVGDRAKRQRQ